MDLKKKINPDTLAGAHYLPDGIALGISQKNDKFMNSVAILECVDGELRLTIYDDAIQRYGLKVKHANINPKEW